jgi:ABC-type nitrate/sulfonate/bicarbonate transport system substrate-binding protein
MARGDLGWLSEGVTRRSFLRTTGRAVGLTAVASSGLLAACGNDTPSAGPTTGSTTGAAKEMKVRMAYSSSTFPSIVNSRSGPLDYGSQFGLTMTSDDLQFFQDHATATQAVLSGQADVVVGSFLSNLLLIQQGQDFKALCSTSNGNDLLMLGSGPIDSIDKVTSDQAIVAIDSPGGLVNLVYNAMFLANGIQQNVEDLPNVQVYGDSPPRTQSFLDGKTNVAVVHKVDVPKVEEALGTGNVFTLSTLWEDVHGLILESAAAPTKWLDENPDAAAALMKAQCTANRELAKDYTKYKAAVDKFIPGSGLTDTDLMPIWELARQFEFWPYNGDMEDSAISFTENVGKQSGVFTGDLPPDQVADRTALSAALNEIGTVTVQDITG